MEYNQAALQNNIFTPYLIIITALIMMIFLIYFINIFYDAGP